MTKNVMKVSWIEGMFSITEMHELVLCLGNISRVNVQMITYAKCTDKEDFFELLLSHLLQKKDVTKYLSFATFFKLYTTFPWNSNWFRDLILLIHNWFKPFKPILHTEMDVGPLYGPSVSYHSFWIGLIKSLDN